MRSTKLRCAFMTTAALLGAHPEARATTKHWVRDSGFWTTPANWSPAGMPLDFDNVFMQTFDDQFRVITYNVNDGFFHVYGDVTVRSPGTGGIEFRPNGMDLDMNSLTLGGISQAAALYNSIAADTFVNTATLGFNGLLHLNASSPNAGSTFRATNFTQDSGYIGVSAYSLLEVNGTYRFNGGFVEGLGRVRTNGTTVLNSDFGAGTLENHGTLVFNSPTDDMFFGSLDNSGTLVFNTNAPGIGRIDFASVTNRVSNTLPANKSIHLRFRLAHLDGTFTQLGRVEALGELGELWVAGGTWIQATDELTGTGMGKISIDGTYLLNSGPLFTRELRIAYLSDGSFVQNAGSATIQVLNVSAGSGAYTRRGHYQLNAGTLTAGATTIGGADTTGGSFVQTGGAANLGGVVMNVDSTSNAVLSLSGGSLTFTRLVNNGTYAQSGGVASTTGHIDGGGVISVTGTGSLTAARIRQNAVNIGGDGRIKLINPTNPYVSPASRVQSLTFEQAGSAVRGTWDLGTQTLVIEYGDPSPAANIRRYLASGYAGGSWNGTGLSSSAAAADAGRKTALGYAEGSQLFGAAGGVYDGVFIDSSSIVVALTLYGDANLDGIVNLSDFNRLAANFGQSNGTWFGGDFNYDGLVNLSDFNAMAANFGLSAAGPEVTPDDWATLAAAVPEPTGIAWIGFSLALLPRQRRKVSRGALQSPSLMLQSAAQF